MTLARCSAAYVHVRVMQARFACSCLASLLAHVAMLECLVWRPVADSASVRSSQCSVPSYLEECLSLAAELVACLRPELGLARWAVLEAACDAAAATQHHPPGDKVAAARECVMVEAMAGLLFALLHWAPGQSVAAYAAVVHWLEHYRPVTTAAQTWGSAAGLTNRRAAAADPAAWIAGGWPLQQRE